MRISSGPTTLGEAGYRTAYVGKWHLSGEPQGNRWVPPDRRAGFGDFVGWESPHVDHWAGRIWRDDPASSQPSPEELPMPGHETDALTDMAIEKVEELAAQAVAFCLCLGYQAPHPPCSPPTEFEALYANEVPRLPNLPDRPPAYKKPEWKAEYSNDEFRRRYWGEVSHLDAAAGRFLDAAEALGLFDSSVIVFTSDHGEMAGARGRYGKWVMFEESVRVPLLVSVPGQPATGRRARDLISTVDFLPTFSEIAGANPPADLPGVSFARRWRTLAGAGDPAAAGPRRYAFLRPRATESGRNRRAARRRGSVARGTPGLVGHQHGSRYPGGLSL